MGWHLQNRIKYHPPLLHHSSDLSPTGLYAVQEVIMYAIYWACWQILCCLVVKSGSDPIVSFLKDELSASQVTTSTAPSNYQHQYC